MHQTFSHSTLVYIVLNKIKNIALKGQFYGKVYNKPRGGWLDVGGWEKVRQFNKTILYHFIF
jgi:hypothetical protein